jgi:predicted nucleotidyltransferase
MKREIVIAALKRHEPELKELGVVSASLFGSTARNEAGANSDIDIAVSLEDISGGFATLGRLDQIRDRLSAILGRPVDLIPEPPEASPLKNTIDKDRYLAF